jgi:hypothetical protein
MVLQVRPFQVSALRLKLPLRVKTVSPTAIQRVDEKQETAYGSVDG